MLDLHKTTQFLSQLLLDYKPQEVGAPSPAQATPSDDSNTMQDIIQPGAVDLAAQGLVNLLHVILCDVHEQAGLEMLPPRQVNSGITCLKLCNHTEILMSLTFSSFTTQLFWHHLFPHRWSSANSLWQGDVTYSEATRCQLINIILRIAGRNPEQIRLLIEDLKSLVPCSTNDETEDCKIQLVNLHHLPHSSS